MCIHIYIYICTWSAPNVQFSRRWKLRRLHLRRCGRVFGTSLKSGREVHGCWSRNMRNHGFWWPKIYGKYMEHISDWWFGTVLIFPYIGNNTPNLLIFFRGVETTNQINIWDVTWFDGHISPTIFNIGFWPRYWMWMIYLLDQPCISGGELWDFMAFTSRYGI